MIKNPKTSNFIKFIGTAGARFVTISQARASGGTWISFEGTNILIDPGPGSLVRCLQSDPPLDSGALDAIILTHKHIDHSNDINIMIEAMTHGGSKKRGVVFLPGDMMESHSILLEYARALPEKIVILNAKESYSVGNIRFTTPVRHIHSVETYGLKFHFNNKIISFIADTKYSPELVDEYKGDVVIINTVFIESLENVHHLSLRDAEKIIERLRPQKAILTHFGRDILREGPEALSQKLESQCGIPVIAASDGMCFPLD